MINLSILKIAFRHLKIHTLQTFLLIIGISLGVAVSLSVDIANQSAKKSFILSTEILTGKATHQIESYSVNGFDENIFTIIRKDLKIKKSAPIVKDYVNFSSNNLNLSFTLFGIDPFSEYNFRNYIYQDNNSSFDKNISKIITKPNTVIISQELAKLINKNEGDNITVNYKGKNNKIEIIKILKVNDNINKEFLKDIIITDISTAQEILDKIGLLSNIDLILEKNDIEKLNQLCIDKNLKLIDIKKNNSTFQMTKAFEINLQALSLLALLVGMFLIYNTVTFSVLQRRKIFGILRSIGVTRKELFFSIIFENFLIGVFSSIIGIILGVFLSKIILSIITQTINDLYYRLNVTQLDINIFTLIKGFILGVLSSTLASIPPAFEANFIEPINATKPSIIEIKILKKINFISFLGLLINIFALYILFIDNSSIELAFTSLFLIVIGISLLVPISTILFINIFNKLFSNYIPIYSKIGIRNITKSLSRTTIAISALMVSISVIIGMGTMIDSFRKNVIDWLDTVLTADIFITEKNNESIDISIVNDIKKIENIDEIAIARTLKINTKNYGNINLQSVSKDISYNRKYIWKKYKFYDINKELNNEKSIVSESFYYHNKLKLNNNLYIEIESPNGIKKIEVIAVYKDYAGERGTIIINNDFYKKYWYDNLINSIAIYSKNPNKVIETLKDKFNNKYNLSIQSNKSLKDNSIEVFDRTFLITDALKILTILISFIGVLSAIMALQLEKIREIGILRANGMTLKQVSLMIFSESTFIGFIAGIFAIPLGIIMSLILIYIINVRSFGWTIDFLINYKVFIESIIISCIAGFLAGLYPSFKIKKLNIINAIRYE